MSNKCSPLKLIWKATSQILLPKRWEGNDSSLQQDYVHFKGSFKGLSGMWTFFYHLHTRDTITWEKTLRLLSESGTAHNAVLITYNNNGSTLEAFKQENVFRSMSALFYFVMKWNVLTMTDEAKPIGDVPEVWWQPGIHNGCISVAQASVLYTPHFES